MHRGYIKLWRRVFDSAVWSDLNLWRTWCCCLLSANYKKKWVSVDGLAKPVEVHPGQFITGRFAFHQAMYPKRKKKNPSPITVWRWLQTLNSLGNLNIETNKRYSLITINNWDIYQQKKNENEQANEQAMNKQRSTGDQPVITNKKDKKVKNDKKTNRASSWPKDFELTDEMKTHAIDNGLSPQKVDSFFEDFHDWALSKGATYKDWQAAFRTRVKKAPQFGQQFMANKEDREWQEALKNG